MTKNIVEFPSASEEPTEPTYYTYEISVRKDDGTDEIIKCEGYLIATPAFIGVCKGQFTKSEFMFIAPMEQVRYANSLGPIKFTGKP